MVCSLQRFHWAHFPRATNLSTSLIRNSTAPKLFKEWVRTILVTQIPETLLSRRPFDDIPQVDALWTGLLGRKKYAFVKTYCGRSFANQVPAQSLNQFDKPHSSLAGPSTFLARWTICMTGLLGGQQVCFRQAIHRRVLLNHVFLGPLKHNPFR